MVMVYTKMTMQRTLDRVQSRFSLVEITLFWGLTFSMSVGCMQSISTNRPVVEGLLCLSA